MPLDGEKLDELLSGFIDGVLTEAERKIVEEAARDDARIEQRILLLRRQAGEVGEVGKLLVEQSHRQLDLNRHQSLAETVIAQARQQAVRNGLTKTHFVHGHADRNENLVTVSSPRSASLLRRPGKRWIVLTGSMAAAAAILLALALNRSNESNPATDVASSTPNVVPDLPESMLATGATSSHGSPSRDLPTPDNSSPRLVGQFDHLTYVLVADVQITSAGIREEILESVLAGAGISRVEPVVADAKIIKALDQSRMIVEPKGKPSERVYIMVIRAEMNDIDAALRNIWKDSLHFPNVNLNLAVDARAGLVRDILNGTSGRFSLNDSFAVPLAGESPAPRLAASSPFPGPTNGVSYVSSSKRASGWGGADALSVPPSDSIATILLVIHVAE